MERIPEEDFADHDEGGLNDDENVGSVASADADNGADADADNGAVCGAPKENPVNGAVEKEQADEAASCSNMTHKLNEAGAASVEENAAAIPQTESDELTYAEWLKARKMAMVKETLDLYISDDRITENAVQRIFAVAEECKMREMSYFEFESHILQEMNRFFDDNSNALIDENLKHLKKE